MDEWRIDRKVLIDSVEHSGWLPEGAAKPSPTKPRHVEVWISHESDAYYLFITDGEHVFDTWHQTLVDAMNQAEFEYGIRPEEWRRAAAHA
jgi:hypothetical protein